MKEFKNIEIKTKKITDAGIGQWIVTIKDEDWNELQKNGEKAILANLQIPGFRKGFVPLALAKDHIKEHEILNKAANKAATLAYEHYLKQNNELDVKALSQPNVTVDHLTRDKVVITYNFNLPFSLKLKKYRDLAIEKKPIKVTKVEVDEQLKLLKDRFALYSDKEAGIVEKGDTVVIDFDGRIKGESFPGGSAKDRTVEIGSGAFIPGFENQMIGMKLNERRIIKVKFPKNYQIKNLADVEADFDVYVKEIKIKHVNDDLNELVKDVNIEKVTNAAELLSYLKTKIAEFKANEQREELLELIFDEIIASAKIILPNQMIEKEKKRLLEEFKQDVNKENIKYEDYKKVAGLTDSEIDSEIEQDAIIELKRYFIIQEIIKLENITVDEQEIDDYIIANIQPNVNVSVAEIKQQLPNLNFINENIKRKKVHDWLIANNTVTKTKTKQELK